MYYFLRILCSIPWRNNCCGFMFLYIVGFVCVQRKTFTFLMKCMKVCINGKALCSQNVTKINYQNKHSEIRCSKTLCIRCIKQNMAFLLSIQVYI